MENWDLYDSLIDEAKQILGSTSSSASNASITNVVLGLNWTVVEVDLFTRKSQGICFSPVNPARTLSWSGTLIGRPVVEVFDWLKQWEPAAAAIGCAAINAVINSSSDSLAQSHKLLDPGPTNVQVFNHFRPQLADARVAVIGNYPSLDAFPECKSWSTIERNPQGSDYPDPASAYILPESDWVFLTASSLANKTLPILLHHAQHAQVVLLGPSLPWSSHWKRFGVSYLAGVEIVNSLRCFQVASEAGGTRLFDGPCAYRVLTL